MCLLFMLVDGLLKHGFFRHGNIHPVFRQIGFSQQKHNWASPARYRSATVLARNRISSPGSPKGFVFVSTNDQSGFSDV